MPTLKELFSKFNFLQLEFLCNSEYIAYEKYSFLSNEIIVIDIFQIKKIDIINPKILDFIITKNQKKIAKIFYIKIMEENGYSKTMINKFKLSFGYPIVDIIDNNIYQIIVEEPWSQNIMEVDFVFKEKNAKIIIKYDCRKYSSKKDIVNNCITILQNEIE